MRRRLPLIVLLLGLLPFGQALGQTPEERGLTIALEAERRDTGFGDSSAELLMVLEDRRGEERTRELTAEVLEVEDDGDKSLLTFESPPDVRGTAMLTFAHKQDGDDQWLYLPALKRVKRISASNRTGPFMGSEFAYEDLASDEVEKFEYRWLRDEPCPGEEAGPRTCFVVERRPNDADSGYSRQVVWIDQDEYRTIQVDYYDRSGSLLKTLSFAQYRQYLGQFWRPHRMLMVNHQTERRTRLEWTSFEFRTGLTANDFTPQSLARIR